jgi:hypothetical protein
MKANLKLLTILFALNALTPATGFSSTSDGAGFDPSDVTVVYGEGEAPIDLQDAVDLAKQAATQDAEVKCGGPVEMAENLGWEIEDTDFEPPCVPHRFCGSSPTKVHAKALFRGDRILPSSRNPASALRAQGRRERTGASRLRLSSAERRRSAHRDLIQP